MSQAERTQRVHAEQPLESRARRLSATIRRATTREEEAREVREDAEAQLLAIHAAAEARFGRSIPPNALLLDVLDQIDIVDGDRWLWRGMRNNKRLPTLRVDGGEKSVPRYLAVEFSVIDEAEFGILYPSTRNDVDDVNPWHRVLRASSRPVGNRWAFRLPTGGDA